MSNDEDPHGSCEAEIAELTAALVSRKRALENLQARYNVLMDDNRRLTKEKK